MHYYFGPPMHLLSGVDNLPRTKCSRLIRPIVSTTSIPRHPLASPSGSACTSLRKGGQSWTPITPLPGSIFHAETQLRLSSGPTGKIARQMTDGCRALAGENRPQLSQAMGAFHRVLVG